MKQYQELETEEIEEPELEQEEEEEENLQNFTHKKGWGRWVGSIVRKAAILGATAVVAAIVIPTAVVLSTLRGAFCVPFGMYLGTVALTDRFMSSLLPLVQIEEEPRQEEFQICFEKIFEDHQEQTTYTEEEIWQQMKLIRAVIGYKASLHTSI